MDKGTGRCLFKLDLGLLPPPRVIGLGQVQPRGDGNDSPCVFVLFNCQKRGSRQIKQAEEPLSRGVQIQTTGGGSNGLVRHQQQWRGGRRYICLKFSSPFGVWNL